MACDGDCGNWGSLPKDIWGVILDKLDLPQDYIRFGAVCKLWQSIAEDQQQNRLSTITKVPPLLLIPTPDKSKHCRNLYSIIEQKVYNCRIEIPFGIWGFSSHGWWAAAEQDLSISLLNPFSKKTIHLPTIASSNLNAPFIYADPKIPENVICKVVLSCNPSIYPSGFLVVVIYDLDEKLAFIRHGEQSWTYVEEYDHQEAHPRFKDALFYKGKLYAVKGSNKFVILGSNGECEYFDGPYEELHRNGYDETSNRSYLVESSSGDLLLIRRLHRHTIEMTRGEEWAKSVLKSTVDFKVYSRRKKMEGQPSTKQEDFEWIEIQRLDNDDVIFLGDNQTICISASQFPNCRPNCIYFTDDCKQRNLWKKHKSHDMGFFDLEDRKIRKFFKLNRSLRQMPPPTWIFATC